MREINVFADTARPPVSREHIMATGHKASDTYNHAYYDAPDGTYGGYQYDGRYAAPAARIVELFNLTPDSRVLEIGCAKGFLLTELQKLGMRVRGIEISSYAVDTAHPDVKDRITLIEPGEWPMFWRKFDLVICKEVLPHIEEKWIPRKINYLMGVARHQLVEIQVAETSEAAEKMLAWDKTHRTCKPADWWRGQLTEAGYQGVVSFKELFPCT